LLDSIDKGESVMNVMKLITAVAAVGAVAIVSSQAAALVCYSPAPGFFSHIVRVSGVQQELEMSCQSTPTGGQLTRLVGRASGSRAFVGADLTAGPSSGYARAGAYGLNRQGLGCFAIDVNPLPSTTVYTACASTVGFVDMEMGIR
jgi:hypothetical protein